METFVALLLTLNALPRAVHDKQIQSNLNHGVTSTYSVLLILNARAVHGNRSPALVVMRCS
jgi:hypothetical protein